MLGGPGKCASHRVTRSALLRYPHPLHFFHRCPPGWSVWSSCRPRRCPPMCSQLSVLPLGKAVTIIASHRARVKHVTGHSWPHYVLFKNPFSPILKRRCEQNLDAPATLDPCQAGTLCLEDGASICFPKTSDVISRRRQCTALTGEHELQIGKAGRKFRPFSFCTIIKK